MTPDPFEQSIAYYEAQDRQTPPPKGAILFVGSSSIERWQTLEEDFPEFKTLNRGIGSTTIEDWIRFIPRLIHPYAPSEIVFYAGDNDLAYGKEPARVEEDFEKFITLVRAAEPGTPIHFISIKPSPQRVHLLGKVRETNSMMAAFAGRTPGVNFVDIFTPMLGPDGAPNVDLFFETDPSRNGLHLNRAGYDLWVAAVKPLLGRARR
ncbi:MAG: hypothetical protein HY059_18600 [Proteobacteria bacterium]|nr:hypothetical protein [Pseudomonadota bacterium]